MALSKRNQAASTRDLKHRVLTCLHRLSDRDTHSAAAAELDSIAKTLSHDCIPPFVSSIAVTDSSDKSPVRKQCLRLISLLSEHHGNSLSPYLSKLLSAIVRRLRDSDSAVRAASVAATASISSYLTKPPFSSIIKPFIDALVTEQDINSQIGAALCLASAIDASADPEPMYLRKLLPRLEKLLKSESFKAKAALLTLIGSVVGSGGASSHQAVRNLVPCLVEFVSSEDWAARKSASEALVKLAVVERDSLPEFKASCLKIFEAKKVDKVKIVRETMNQMVEAWKEIPDVSEELSPSPESQSSSKEDASDGRYPPGAKITTTYSPGPPQIRNKNNLANKSTPIDGSSATTARKRTSLGSIDKKTGPAMFRKLDRKKPNDWKLQIAAPQTSSRSLVGEDDPEDVDEKEENGSTKADVKRALFNKNYGGKVENARSESTVVVSNSTENLGRQKECDDLSLIRNQLVQIENQQSNLLDLLQRFIGSSQNGMHSLETRVHGLELALDEISYDLAVSTGRMSSTDSGGTMCCKLPGAEFLSSKLWRKTTESRNSTSRFSSGGTPSVAALRKVADKSVFTEPFNMEQRRFRNHGGGGGLIVNPLAEIHSDSHGISEVSSSRAI